MRVFDKKPPIDVIGGFFVAGMESNHGLQVTQYLRSRQV